LTRENFLRKKRWRIPVPRLIATGSKWGLAGCRELATEGGRVSGVRAVTATTL
jgi:hypothetical protein